jgi:hypothetical protein
MARAPTRDAVLKGMRAALRLQPDLGLDQGAARGHRVDVFGAIYRQNVPLLFWKLNRSWGPTWLVAGDACTAEAQAKKQNQG